MWIFSLAILAFVVSAYGATEPQTPTIYSRRREEPVLSIFDQLYLIQ
ncbi:MAG: hypothetical protein HYY41_01005 [Chloroflexi bacterium]|nr:hypothetical protein [Chloroflexota bacterium]